MYKYKSVFLFIWYKTALVFSGFRARIRTINRSYGKKEMSVMSMFHKIKLHRERSEERWFRMMQQAMLFRQIP